jgi:hypothetical protein
MSGGLTMLFHFGNKSGEKVPGLDQSLTDLQGALAQRQKEWAEQLARDPASFPVLEEQIHLVFEQLADQCAAGLLAHAAAAPACSDAAKKSRAVQPPSSLT